MDALMDIYYWLKLVLLVVVVVLALLGAVRGSGTHAFVLWRAAAQGVCAILAFGAMVWFAQPGLGFVWAIVLIVLGGVAGFFVARSTAVTEQAGRTYVHMPPLAPWVWAIGAILVTMTLLFGSVFLFALPMLVLALGLGLVLGQICGESVAVSRK